MRATFHFREWGVMYMHVHFFFLLIVLVCGCGLARLMSGINFNGFFTLFFEAKSLNQTQNSPSRAGFPRQLAPGIFCFYLSRLEFQAGYHLDQAFTKGLGIQTNAKPYHLNLMTFKNKFSHKFFFLSLSQSLCYSSITVEYLHIVHV